MGGGLKGVCDWECLRTIRSYVESDFTGVLSRNGTR